VGEQLNPQDGLYTLARNRPGRLRVIGSVAEVMLATKIRGALRSSAAPSTHIVTFTVTEKGYCRAGDGSLDLARAELYLLLADAFARARRRGSAG
jgi:fructuronate reductase